MVETWGCGKGVPAEALEGTGVEGVEADTFGSKAVGRGRVRLGTRLEMELLDPSDHLLLAPAEGTECTWASTSWRAWRLASR